MSRAAARHQRRQEKKKDHGPLLRLVEEEITRAPVRASRAPLKPLTEAQRLYGAAIRASRVTFGIGPAGTGKTWFAAALAAEALLAGEIERIIITRPAQEAADEKMGFLPGELDEKIEPYFRPVRDALEERLGSGQLEYLIKSKTIEVRPLAFLRGATFKRAMIIADEMQNSTVTGMKMLLTRMGEGSTMVVNGDPDQCDLPDPAKSGLLDAIDRLKHVQCVSAIHFGVEDIVRDSVVQEIVEAYMRKRP
ncbi:PhoH family protein [Bradyrhizobium sp. 179]|uniref:PhoH family protein n=1 Tax=Bradyrhizobium sp. 179 TaxID=2782648 RepID=UPI001FF84ACF|nr:PhoH family protein [Bradyrhizobium sp. 179]MCK1543279.1 PhoH family protein [Bradyrhizobium sp. 179]